MQITEVERTERVLNVQVYTYGLVIMDSKNYGHPVMNGDELDKFATKNGHNSFNELVEHFKEEYGPLPVSAQIVEY